MNRRAALAVLATAAAVCAAAFRQTAGSTGDLLPGRSRPLLEHNWPHPRDLRFGRSRFEAPDPRSSLIVSPSGLHAYVISVRDERVVQIAAAVPLGRAFEQPKEAGAAELLSRMLTQQLRDQLGPTLGSRLQVDQEIDLTRVSVQILSDEWQLALSGFIRALRNVRVDGGMVDAYRTGAGYVRQTRGLGGAGFRPAVELARLVGSHPQAPPAPGQSVSREAVERLAAFSLSPRSVVLGIGGGVIRTDVERELRASTAGWTRASAGIARVADAPLKPSKRLETIEEPGYTTWVAVGHAMPAIASADEAAVAVMGEILNIRLNIATREIRGLANQTVLQMSATTRGAGLLHVRTGARPESIAPLIHYSIEELTRIRESDGAPTDEELEQAKGGLILGKWQGSLDGARAASGTYAAETVRYKSLDHLTRWPDVVRAVTAPDVRRVATTYIRPAELVTVIVGQVDAVRKAWHPRWPFSLDEVVGR